MSDYNSDYEVRLATLSAMGGDATQRFDSVYEIDKEILRLTQEGGGGGGLQPIIVDELPETGEAGKMYFVPNEDPGVQDNYKEYIWVEGTPQTVYSASEEGFEGEYLPANAMVAIPKTDVSYDLSFYMGGSINIIREESSNNLLIGQGSNNTILLIEESTLDGTHEWPNLTYFSALGSDDDYYYIKNADSEDVKMLISVLKKAVATLVTTYQWECIGNANVDMSDYAKQSDFTALTTALPTTYNPYNTVTANSNSLVFAKWNARGQVVGAGSTVYQASQSINGASRTLYSTSSTSLPALYAPTTAGTLGQVLVSNGSGAPTWNDYKSDATAYISEEDCINETYSDDIQAFYADCILNNHIGPMQIVSKTAHTDGDETTYSYSYYLPSSTRLYEGNVEIWLFATEDGHTWTNRHILITNTKITSDITTGTFGA